MQKDIFLSISGTMESIREILEKGRINDAYGLMRKYYEAITIQIYFLLHISEHAAGIRNKKYEEDDSEAGINRYITKLINDLFDNPLQTWIDEERNLPHFSVMARFIKDRISGYLDTELLSLQTYIDLRRRCEDNLHYNSPNSFVLNNSIAEIDRMPVLNQLSEDLRDLFILHFVYILTIAGDIFKPSKGFFALFNFTNSELLSDIDGHVLPVIQAIFDKVVQPYSSELADAVVKSTSVNLVSRHTS
jgi:hypothetical protein